MELWVWYLLFSLFAFILVIFCNWFIGENTDINWILKFLMLSIVPIANVCMAIVSVYFITSQILQDVGPKIPFDKIIIKGRKRK